MKKRLLDELESYKQIATEEESPNIKCLDLAKEFVKILPHNVVMPNITIAGGEDVALYWRNEFQYLIVTFNADQTLSYFFNNKKTSSKRSQSRIEISQNQIPLVLLALIYTIEDKKYHNIYTDKIVDELKAELSKAEEKHPIWPTDAVHASAILNEEAGELTQSALDFHYGDTADVERMREEAIQVGAMALRFLKNLDGYRKNY